MAFDLRAVEFDDVDDLVPRRRLGAAAIARRHTHAIQLQALLHGERAGEDAEEIDLIAALNGAEILHVTSHLRQLILPSCQLQGDVLQVRIVRIKFQLLLRLMERPGVLAPGRQRFVGRGSRRSGSEGQHRQASEHGQQSETNARGS